MGQIETDLEEGIVGSKAEQHVGLPDTDFPGVCIRSFFPATSTVSYLLQREKKQCLLPKDNASLRLANEAVRCWVKAES